MEGMPPCRSMSRRRNRGKRPGRRRRREPSLAPSRPIWSRRRAARPSRRNGAHRKPALVGRSGFSRTCGHRSSSVRLLPGSFPGACAEGRCGTRLPSIYRKTRKRGKRRETVTVRPKENGSTKRRFRIQKKQPIMKSRLCDV